MRGSFYTDMALKNLSRNRRDYLPYALSCVGTVMVFFIMMVLSSTTSLKGVYGGRTIQRTLKMGVWVMLLFAVIFLFYTHSFLIRQRKKELGLFNILGLEKRHIARVLLVESFLVGIVTTIAGMGMGALLSRLMYLAQLRMLGALQSPTLSIPSSIWPSVALVFLVIHALTVLNTLRQVHLARPVELLRASSVGERAPKARWWLAALGIALLAAGYILSWTTTSPVRSIRQFFLAVLLVIAATYALFTAGTVAALSLMQKNKGFYYQANHFTVVAGMRHRMKRHAVGLATICILSTMVLVMMAATVSLYAGTEDILSGTFPRQAFFSVGLVGATPEADKVETAVRTAAREAGVTPSRMVRYHSQSYFMRYDEKKATFQPQWSAEGMLDITPTSLTLISAEDFEAVMHRPAGLAPGEALVYAQQSPALPERFTVGKMAFIAKEHLQDIGPLGADLASIFSGNHVLILTQQNMDALSAALEHMVAKEDQDAFHQLSPRQLNLAFDTGPLGLERAEELISSLQREASKIIYDCSEHHGGSSNIRHIELDRADHLAVFGGLLFVAVFLGLVFLMALVLIIYYKQVSEGHEDKARFAIIQQVGMSAKEVRQSIRTQVLMVFFLPLVMAGLHLVAAFSITKKILALLGLTNARLFAWVTLATYLAFAVFYLLVYWKTAGSYYRIVKTRAPRERSLP